MATVTADPQTELEAWYSLDAAETTAKLGVDATQGLGAAEVERRTAKYGPNKFAEAKTEPRWRAFERQYHDAMQIVLLVVGIGSIWPLRQYGTGILVLVLTVFNAILGLHQEGKAAEAVAALQKMMFIKARVRRDGQLIEVNADQLVPGDVVAIEAGDIVPADGRLLEAATLEIAESALTGESLPVSKSVETLAAGETPLGDRTDMVYMNTNVTRGSGLFVVTATGMSTGRPFIRSSPRRWRSRSRRFRLASLRS
jgi:Ca2+-transporting ATPase